MHKNNSFPSLLFRNFVNDFSCFFYSSGSVQTNFANTSMTIRAKVCFLLIFYSLIQLIQLSCRWSSKPLTKLRRRWKLWGPCIYKFRDCTTTHKEVGLRLSMDFLLQHLQDVSSDTLKFNTIWAFVSEKKKKKTVLTWWLSKSWAVFRKSFHPFKDFSLRYVP